MVSKIYLLLVLNLLHSLSCLCQQDNVKSNVEDLRIINGQEAKWNSSRYQVSIRLERLDRYFYGLGHWCGGTIIAKNVILTAGHCIWDTSSNNFIPASNFSVVMGNLDRSSKNSLKFSVSKIIVSPHFNYGNFRDDIAIMFLKQSLPENYTQSEIIQINDNPNIEAGKKCIVTGWGLTENQTYTRNLMLLEVPIINRETCSLNYGSENLLEGMMCAGYMSGKGDACSGDSGGPLVCDNKLVGIVSFGLGCGIPGYPGIYTNVAYYYDWIRKQVILPQQYLNLNSRFGITNNITNNSTIGGGNSTSKIICSQFVLILSIIFVNLMKYFKI